MPKSQPIERQIIFRNGVRSGIGLAAAFFILYAFVPIPVPPLPRMIDRLVYTLRLQSFSVLTLIGGVLIVSLQRYFTIAVDPINGRGEHHVAVSTRYLTNTVEQFLISFVGQMVLTTYLPERQMKVIPILVAFFVFGRVSFYLGYRKSYLNRTLGYVATFGVSAVLWLFLTCLVVSSLFT
ncbi:transmembrane protein 79 [Aplysia californica]|uniref:Transmembrane protein 79 n=1 Tax=Aplysia californica TaxID=6500 RepID=A0ABM1ABD6_APLCA|nr:transmembrane protein 79 [Aplysia californica]